MNMQDSQIPQQDGEPDEFEWNFYPNDPSVIIPQIQLLSLTNRQFGFETLVNSTNDGLTPEVQQLLDQGIFPLVISSINETNLKIIGLIATALRHLIVVAPKEYFVTVVETIPFPFLFNIPNVPEIIDLLQTTCDMYGEDFAQILLGEKYGALFQNALGTWLLNNEETGKSALELVSTLVQIPGTEGIDFSFVKPFVDGQYSTDIRSLAFNILIQIDPQNAQIYIEGIMNIFFNEKPTSIVFQVIHDLYTTSPEVFAPRLDDIYQRALENLDVPESAILLSDISTSLDQPSREQILAQIFQQPELCIERADSIFSICQKNQMTLPPEFLAQLVGTLLTNQSEETLECVEAILQNHPEFFHSPEVQMQLLPAFEREQQFAVFPFKLILACCHDTPVTPEILTAVHDFATLVEANLDQEMHDKISHFLASHSQ